jgi:hypothetical protein
VWRPELGWTDVPVSGDIERVGHVQVGVSPRDLLPERLERREEVSQHEQNLHRALAVAGEGGLVTTKKEPVGRIFCMADSGW